MHRKNSQPYFTEQDLVDLDDTLYAFQVKFQATIAQHMPSQGKTIKFHKLSHLTSGIRRMGAPKHESAQFMEQKHAQVKTFYSGGCKRTRNDADHRQIVEKTRQHALAQALEGDDTSEPREARETVYMATARDGQPKLVQSGHTVAIEHLSMNAAHPDNTQVPDFVKKLKAAQAEVSMLPDLLRTFADSQTGGALHLPTSIKVVKTGCIPGKVRTRDKQMYDKQMSPLHVTDDKQVLPQQA